MVSNLHAGKEFYLNSLSSNYQISFSDDFASVMDAIEEEYKAANGLTDVSGSGTVSTSADMLLVRNWQDILAVYIYGQSQQGVETYVLDSSCKEALADIFAEMNPILHDSQDASLVGYGNLHVEDYIAAHGIDAAGCAVLNKYMETDCKLLCAVVTAAKGFVRESVGDEVSEERVNVIAAAYSLVGKVGYFWGGKSTAIGEDANWGTVAQVTAEGSSSTGTLRAYGLDCSGFVTWSVINGYQDTSMQTSVGDGTSDQWLNAGVVTEQDAQPGDFVFENGPEAGSDNHVGILCGKTDSGDWIAVHCSAGQNGVTVGEAYGAGFRYIRQPSFYPTQSEVDEMRSNLVISEADDTALADETVTSETAAAEDVFEEENTTVETVPTEEETVEGDAVDASTPTEANPEQPSGSDDVFEEEIVISYRDNISSIIDSGNHEELLTDDNDIEVFDMDDGLIEEFELVCE
jgi:cell wall-associated NlpC family hydrolase